MIFLHRKSNRSWTVELAIFGVFLYLKVHIFHLISLYKIDINTFCSVKGVLNDYQIFLEKFPELSAEPVVPESIWRSTVVEEVDMHNYEHIANGPGNGKFEATSNHSVI